MMKRTFIIAGVVIVVAITAFIIINKLNSKKDMNILYAEVKKGDFDIVVTTTGELMAEKSADIRGPEIAQSRNLRSMDIKIQDLVPEGTEVEEGDYVATLDRTTFDNSLKDALERLETAVANYELRILDTTVSLSNYRDGIKNQTISVEEAALTLQQSKFEPPTTIRQAQINLERAQRTLEQQKRQYELRVEQTKSDIRVMEANLARQRESINDFQTVLSKFIITAPAPGMVIYKKERNGAKRKVGSSITPFDPVVATLPDMSSMISKTYVNEIDISKVKMGQKVNISIDAFPESAYTGEVISVANVGEQLPNADAKVFEVQIKVDGSDPKLRPSMTTGNKVVTQTIENVIYIPLECVQTGIDSIPFVYEKNGTRQIVLLGESNENNVIVEQGLEPGTILYLSTPENPERFKLAGEDLKTIILEREKARKAEEDKLKKNAESSMGGRGFSRGSFGQGGQRGQGGRDTSAARRRTNMQRGQQGEVQQNTP
jgi:HlyD family secretion protein